MRTLRVVLWLAVALALFVLGALATGLIAGRDTGGLQAGQSRMIPGGPLGGAFTLVDHEGQPVTEAVFREKPSAVLFGFTHCPDVCPTALMEMSGWVEALGADADRMRFVFVTVDPERDTPAAMRDYVSAFSDRIVGVTASRLPSKAMLRDYKIPFSKVPHEGGDYSMDHLASVILLDGKGSFVGTIARDEKRDVAVAKLQKLVAG
jgi:protein SCO1/2